MAYLPPDEASKPTSPPAGADPTSGMWRWNGTAWTWYVAPENSFLGDPQESEYTRYMNWLASQKGKADYEYDENHTPIWAKRMAEKYGVKFTGGPSGSAFGSDSPINFSTQSQYDKQHRDYGLQLKGAEAVAAAGQAKTDFGNEMANTPLSYTPFGLQSRSAFGGFGGFPQRGLSYASDQLVPSLEQRRMGMMQQMFKGGQ